MPLSIAVDQACAEAADLISRADGLLITAGAGIGIDSGLPDFRGDRGFWNAYPALGNLGMRFHEVANPNAFRSMPEIAWGFYGHRLKLYRDTVPHAGFGMLLRMVRDMPNGAFVFTSNVDGHFQKAGFAPEHVVECHGSIHFLQCLEKCGQPIWPADSFEPVIDTEKCRLLSGLPACPACGGLARPNILLFNDRDWDETRTARQYARLRACVAGPAAAAGGRGSRCGNRHPHRALPWRESGLSADSHQSRRIRRGPASRYFDSARCAGGNKPDRGSAIGYRANLFDPRPGPAYRTRQRLKPGTGALRFSAKRYRLHSAAGIRSQAARCSPNPAAWFVPFRITGCSRRSGWTI